MDAPVSRKLKDSINVVTIVLEEIYRANLSEMLGEWQGIKLAVPNRLYEQRKRKFIINSVTAECFEPPSSFFQACHRYAPYEIENGSNPIRFCLTDDQLVELANPTEDIKPSLSPYPEEPDKNPERNSEALRKASIDTTYLTSVTSELQKFFGNSYPAIKKIIDTQTQVSEVIARDSYRLINDFFDFSSFPGKNLLVYPNEHICRKIVGVEPDGTAYRKASFEPCSQLLDVTVTITYKITTEDHSDGEITHLKTDHFELTGSDAEFYKAILLNDMDLANQLCPQDLQQYIYKSDSSDNSLPIHQASSDTAENKTHLPLDPIIFGVLSIAGLVVGSIALDLGYSSFMPPLLLPIGKFLLQGLQIFGLNSAAATPELAMTLGAILLLSIPAFFMLMAIHQWATATPVSNIENKKNDTGPTITGNISGPQKALPYDSSPLIQPGKANQTQTKQEHTHTKSQTYV